MKRRSYNFIVMATFIWSLSFLQLSFFSHDVQAQTQTSEDRIEITAEVIGCGDGKVQPSLGEQCDGDNLNGQSCSDLGYSGGSLGCRASCIFKVDACTSTPGGGNTGGQGGGSGSSNVSSNGGGQALRPGAFSSGQRPVVENTTNLIFRGRGVPGATVTVFSGGSFLGRSVVDENGNFEITVTEVEKGNYDFRFFSDLGGGETAVDQRFRYPVQQNLTTLINNINLLPRVIPSLEEQEETTNDDLSSENILIEDDMDYDSLLVADLGSNTVLANNTLTINLALDDRINHENSDQNHTYRIVVIVETLDGLQLYSEIQTLTFGSLEMIKDKVTIPKYLASGQYVVKVYHSYKNNDGYVLSLKETITVSDSLVAISFWYVVLVILILLSLVWFIARRRISKKEVQEK